MVCSGTDIYLAFSVHTTAHHMKLQKRRDITPSLWTGSQTTNQSSFSASKVNQTINHDWLLRSSHLIPFLCPVTCLATDSNKKAQTKYKAIYNWKAAFSSLKVRYWVLIKLSGRKWKVSKPLPIVAWVILCGQDFIQILMWLLSECTHPNKPVRIHLSWVTPCPIKFPAGSYCYGTKWHSLGHPAKWVQQLLSGDTSDSTLEFESIIAADEPGKKAPVRYLCFEAQRTTSIMEHQIPRMS